MPSLSSTPRPESQRDVQALVRRAAALIAQQCELLHRRRALIAQQRTLLEQRVRDVASVADVRSRSFGSTVLMLERDAPRKTTARSAEIVQATDC